MDEQKYILSNLVDLTGYIKSFLTLSSRIKVKLKYFPDYLSIHKFINIQFVIYLFLQYTVFDASREFLIFSATSGSLYIFKRNPFSFVKVISQ